MAGVKGRSGRKPKPAAQKALAGNPGRRKSNHQEPDFNHITDIFPPEWMGKYGVELWECIAPQLCREKILQGTDIQNLQAYCSAYHRFREAEAHIAQHGIVMEGAQGQATKNPAATVLNEALKQMATYGAMLGLDPSSRQRLKNPAKTGEENPFAKLIN